MSLSAAEPQYDVPRERFAPPVPVPIATYALIGVNVAMFLLEGQWGGSTSGFTLFRMGANVGREGLLVEPWRVLSSAFLHGGTPHIFMNMYALYVLGLGLERLLRASRVLAVYAASALGGGLLSAVLHDRFLSVGASGAIWGLMAAQFVWMLRLQQRYGKQAIPGGFTQMAQPLLINLAISFLPGIDLFAHLGGGLMGAAVALLFPLQLPADERPWRAAAAVGVLLMAASVIAALAVGHPWQPLPPGGLGE